MARFASSSALASKFCILPGLGWHGLLEGGRKEGRKESGWGGRKEGRKKGGSGREIWGGGTRKEGGRGGKEGGYVGPFLRPFPGNEAHELSPGAQGGVFWVGGQKVDVDYINTCLFLSPNQITRTFQYLKITEANISGTKKPVNIIKELLGIVPGMGGGQICLQVAFFLRENRKHINKIPRKS